MAIVSSIIFFGIFGHSILYVVNSYRNRNIKVFDYVLLWFAVIYAVIPLIHIFTGGSYINDHFKYLIHDYSFFCESVIILAYYFIMLVGYRTYADRGYRINTKIVDEDKLFKLSIVLSVLALFSYAYYVSRYGGLEYVWSNVSQIRSGTDENKNYIGAIALMFTSLLSYAFIIQLYLFYKKYRKRNLLFTPVFILTIIGMLLKSLGDGGRAAMISMFIFWILSIYYMKGRVKTTTLFIVVCISLFIVFFGKTFLFSMFRPNSNLTLQNVYDRQNEIGFIDIMIQEFSHQLLSISNFIHNNFEYRYFKDYFIWIFKPVRFFTEDTFYDSISYYNTNMILGEWDSNIPPGSIGSAYINGGFIAIILQSFIVGRILKFTDNIFHNSNFKNNGVLFLIYIYLFNFYWYALQNGDIALIVQVSLVFFIFLTYLFATKILYLTKVR